MLMRDAAMQIAMLIDIAVVGLYMLPYACFSLPRDTMATR